MAAKRIHRKTERTAKEIARIKSIREQYQRTRPTQEEVLASGNFIGPIPHGMVLQMMEIMQQLRGEREKAGLTVTKVAKLTGMDKASISRLETGNQLNPTISTIYRYAQALGKSLKFVLSNGPARRKPSVKS